MGIKINYLYNSGFIIETEGHIIVIDYYKDSPTGYKKRKENGTLSQEDLKTEKDVLVFATHSHSDHFNPVVFEWSREKDNFNYILSSDIKLTSKYKNINFISPYEEINIKNVKVKAYGSTDLGVSLLIKVDGCTIFHAGDLNWWNWWDESNEYNSLMEKNFKAEVKKIKDDDNDVDICFFPVDPRLRESFNLGAEYFIRNIRTKVFVPMHFGEEYKITRELADLMRNNQEAQNLKIVEIEARGQEILL